MLILVLASSGAWLAALLVTPDLTLALVGVARLAGLIVRGEEVVLSDAWRAGHERALPAIVGGLLGVAASAILATNLSVGLSSGSPVGFSLAVLAGWGLVGLWLTGFPFWTLLADPARVAWSATDVARLTALLLLARPMMLAGLGLALAAVLLASAVLVAALLVVSVAYAALVTAHCVLPAADRLSATSTKIPVGGRRPGHGAIHPRVTQETRHPMTFPVQIGPSTITINRDDRVLVCQPDGRVLGDADGFFTRDTRFISGYEMRMNGVRPLLLSSSPIQFFSARFEFTNDALVDTDGAIPRQSLALRLDRTSQTPSTRTTTSSTTPPGLSA